jgi:hypothetical protein
MSVMGNLCVCHCLRILRDAERVCFRFLFLFFLVDIGFSGTFMY